ncbi:MAG: hypothetical protein JRC99_11705 [Deltaproteobacteria bacterium]|nr:hypothetical protein [Deltaproteobacteria bacterium]
MLCLLALLVIAGCSGIEPLELTNTREEGPERGLFSGPDGEFIIYQKANEDVTRNEGKAAEKETEKSAQ